LGGQHAKRSVDVSDPASSVSSPSDITIVVPGDVEGQSDLSNQPSNDGDDDENNGDGDNS